MLLLSWNSHHATFCDILSRLREKGSFTDVTLACEGKFYPLHKLVLSTCSEYLENIFEKTPCKHPVIVLNDIKCSELEALLSYMYAGEVSVPQSTLSLLIRAAELLQIKGLAVPDTPPSTSKKKIHACNPSHDEISPQAKRRRYEESNTSSQREQSQVLGGSLPSVTSLCGEKKQTSEQSKILTEGLEQEQVDQVIDHLQASEGSSFSQIEDVYIETDIKEEMVEDVDNTNTIRVSDPELDYQSHSSSCKMEDARVGPVTKDGCSFPVSEDYGKQPLDHQEILPPPTNVPDTSVSSTELQGWMTEGALGELSRLDGYSGVGIFESSSPLISQQGAPQQEQQMMDLFGGSLISKSRGGYNRWSPEERLQIAKACMKLGPSRAARELSQKLNRKLSESTVRNILKQYRSMMKRGQLKDNSSGLPTARTGRPRLHQDLEESNFT